VSVSNASLPVGNILRRQQTQLKTAEEYGDVKASKKKRLHIIWNIPKLPKKLRPLLQKLIVYRWPRNSQPLKKTRCSLKLIPVLNQIIPVDTRLPTYT
jgi:hypothetical protein